MENPAVDPIYFKEGLIELDTWRRKPAFFAYSNYIAGVSTKIEQEDLPLRTTLHQNFPNPFNPKTIISFRLSKTEAVQLDIYDIMGRLVQSLEYSVLPAGDYSYVFDGGSLSTGTYYYRLSTGNRQITKPMMLIK